MSMKVLLADPHPEVQSALRLIIDRIPEVTGVSEASSLVQLLAQCAQSCPDLILFDRNFIHPYHSQSLADLIGVLRRLCPCSQVMVMSSRFEAEQEALSAGASGFISKMAAPDEVRSSIVQCLKHRS